jgi:hypothetical protein
MPHIRFDLKIPTRKEQLEQSKKVHKECKQYLEKSKKARSVPPSRDFRCKRGRR